MRFRGFFWGIYLTAMIFLGMNWYYERSLLREIVEKGKSSSSSDISLVRELSRITHQMMADRSEILGPKDHYGPLSLALRSTLMQAGDGGACGSYSHVLADLLITAGFEVRIAQMRCGALYGCHILIEVLVDGKYVAVDPTFNHMFLKNDGSGYASFNDISTNFYDFKDELPDNYDPMYRFEGVRYTNWEKNIVVKVLHAFGNRVLPQGWDNFSLRVYILDVYFSWMVFISILWSLILVSLNLLSRSK